MNIDTLLTHLFKEGEYCPKCDTLRSLHGPCQHQKEQAMNYVKLAMRTQASQEKIRERNYQLGTQATQLNNAARGMAGDVGEVNTCIQNWLEYGKPLDTANLKEELGDVMWRIAQMCDAMGWSLEEVQAANIAKLKARYPEKYSDEQADPDARDKEAEKKAIVLVSDDNQTTALVFANKGTCGTCNRSVWLDKGIWRHYTDGTMMCHSSTPTKKSKNPSKEINEADVREQTDAPAIIFSFITDKTPPLPS